MDSGGLYMYLMLHSHENDVMDTCTCKLTSHLIHMLDVHDAGNDFK